MRPGGAINTPSSASSLSTSSSVGPVPSSPWHSPVPYLFGGLAAMLGLIAFALLILACSYWRLSGNLDGDQEERDPENGEEKSGDGIKPPHTDYEEKIVVIMAGDEKPTFLATPMTSRASSFGNTSSYSSSSSSSSSSSFKDTDKSEKSEKPKEEEEYKDKQGEEHSVHNNRAPQTSEATPQHQNQ